MGTPRNDSVSKSQATPSSANWAFNQVGISFNQAALEFGGSDRTQDIGPQLLLADDVVPQNMGAIYE